MQKKHSVRLSLVIIGLFWAGAAVLAVGAPYFFINIYPRLYDRPSFVPILLLVCVYVAMPVGAATLVCLTRLLKNVEKGCIFDSVNTRYLSSISICCFLAAAESCVVGVFHYALFVFGLMAFLGGIVLRVVMQVLEKAIEIKEENDMTV